MGVLFNGAGFVHHGTVLDCTEEQWDFAFDLNVRSMYRTIKAFLPGMLAKGGGSIVNIASVAGIQGAPPEFQAIGYHASKGGVMLMMKSIAQEVAPHRIRVNSVCPGAVRWIRDHCKLKLDVGLRSRFVRKYKS